MRLRLYLIDVHNRSESHREFTYDEYRRLIHPIFLTTTLNLTTPYILIAAHPSAMYDLPGVDSLHIIINSTEKNLNYVRIFSRYGSALIRNGIAGIVLYNVNKTVYVEINEKGVKLLEEKPSTTTIEICENSIESDLAKIVNINTGLRYSVYVSINLENRQGTELSALILKRIAYLMELSPIFSGPVKREGIITIAKRLVNLELNEDVMKVLEKYSSDRLGCSYCPAYCLNKFREFEKHSLPQVHEYVIDDKLRDLLKDEDSYFALSLLYMVRMAYPEYVRDRVEFYHKLRRLYTGVLLSGLCPFYVFHLVKSRNVELDLCQEFMRYLSSLNIELENVVNELKLSIVQSLPLELVNKLYEYISKCQSCIPAEEVPKLRRLKLPVVQLALDLVADYDVLERIVRECVNAGVKIVEVGTPLVKKYGTAIVQRFSELLRGFPEVVLFADTKTMDVGDLEARLMYLAGADMVAVLAVGVVDKVLEALYEAVKFNRCVLVDLIQVEDPVGYVEKNIEIFRKYSTWLVLCVHRGITEQLRGRGIETDYELVQRLRKMLPEVVIAVAGGLKPGLLRRMRDAGADVLIVGAALYTSRNVYETARKLVEEVS